MITMACAAGGVAETCLPFGYVAELLSAMICAGLSLSVEPRADHARYIASWLEVLRSDKRAIFTAASKAQEIADWMNARQANAHRHDVRGAA